MELRTKKIILVLFISLVFGLVLLLFYYFFLPIYTTSTQIGVLMRQDLKSSAPATDNISFITGIFPFLLFFCWLITVIPILLGKDIKFHLGKEYTPEGEITKGSQNEKIAKAIIIAFIVILVLFFIVAAFFLGFL